MLKPHLEDFLSFRVLPWQYANTVLLCENTTSEFNQEHFKEDVEQICENNFQSIIVLCNQVIDCFPSEKLKIFVLHLVCIYHPYTDICSAN